jgi:signal transduction histidine kinase/ActR/RegA family two-component response regulator
MQASASRPSPRRALALAFGLVLVAALLQWGLRPLLGTRTPFPFFLAAIGIAAMWLGWRPALIVVVGGVVNAMFWLDPQGAAIRDTGDQVSVAVYLLAAAVLLGVGTRLHQSRFREQDLSTQVQDLQALHDLGSRIALLPDLGGQLTAILRALCELQGAQKGLVSLCDPESSTLRATASLGFSQEGEQALGSLSVGVGACGISYLEQRVVIVYDIETEAGFADFHELGRREGFRSIHSRPMHNMAGEVFGVVSIYFEQPKKPTARDNQLGDLCAQMASVLAEREYLRRDAVALSRQVEVALESSAVAFCLFQPVRDAAGNIDDLRWQYLNSAAAHLLGHEVPELVGRAVREVLPGAWDEPGVLSQYVMALEKDATVEFEFRSTHASEGWFHVIASPCEGGLAVWFTDVTERKFHEQTLREADRRKDEFLATLAHELRNPLAPIRQATMIARSAAAKPDQQRWSLEVIDRQVSNMAVLLDDLLDVSRITRGKLDLRRIVSDLREAADSALEAARPVVEARQQQLIVEWPEEPLWAKVDLMRIAQVISNLLTNASKYTHPRGTIRLIARREGTEAVIEVKDNGIGIPRDALERVFEMFTQVKNPHSGASTGLGIGLALSRGLAQMHGASLTAHSEGVGCGSTFTLRLDLCDPPSPGSPTEGNSHETSRSRRVLVADDNRDAAESLAEVLRMEGHDVSLAFDGEAALKLFNQLAPEVALLDIGMPRMTGNEVARAIRSSPGGDATLLVAITGWGQERDRAAARDAGFDFHFTKPVDPDQVLRLIENPEAARQAEEAHG